MVDVDGKNDICSRGEDINFEFIGYKLQGQISNRDDSEANSGAVKVILELIDATGNVLDQAISHDMDGGKYSFTGVATGKYVVRVSAESLQTYSFQETEHAVSVEGGCAQIKDFVILGFDIDGDVLFEDINGDMKGIANWPITIELGTIVKETKTDYHGHFRFSNMSQGSYVIRTSNTIKHNELSMKTAECNLQIRSGKSDPCKIVINGCKINGSITQNENGIPNMEVEIVQGRNKFATMSDGFGVFKSQLLKAGQVVISVVNHKNLKFAPAAYTIKSPLDTLPALKPEKIRYEGLLEMAKTEQKLFVKCTSNEDKVSSEVNHNMFSIFLRKGAYVCTVISDSMESAFFSAISVTVNPNEQQGTRLIFSYSKVLVSGDITCLSSCSDIFVDMFQDTVTKIATAKITGSKFEFNDVRPGKYIIIASGKNACWKKNLIDIEVGANDVLGLKFIQKGRLVTVETDNPTSLKLDDQKYQLENGKHEICIESLAELAVSSESCFIFSFNGVLKPQINDKLELRTVGQNITGNIMAFEVIDDLQIQINDDIVFPLYASKRHQFEYAAQLNQDLLIRPTSQNYFFDPSYIKLNVKADLCSDISIFKAKKGVYITGSVQPPIKGVKIDVQDVSNVETDVNGAFRIGPVSSEDATNIKISATKQGYYFTLKSGENANFIAHKLATILVEIKTKSNEPLLSLVSISGGSAYRNNSHTADGKVVFMSLYPGEYFVKPFMKEYQFEPRSTTLTVMKEMKDNLVVSFIGERTAFTG